MKRYQVLIASGARQDLTEILTYLAENASQNVASRISQKILATIRNLDLFPERGSMFADEDDLGTADTRLRVVISSPYQIYYVVKENTVQVVAILDGRRDIPTILLSRK